MEEMNIADETVVTGLYPIRPCHDCKTRRQGCHSECLKYKVSLMNPDHPKNKKHSKYNATREAVISGLRQRCKDHRKVKDDMAYYFKYNHGVVN